MIKSEKRKEKTKGTIKNNGKNVVKNTKSANRVPFHINNNANRSQIPIRT